MSILFDAVGDYLRRDTNAPDLNGSVTVTWWGRFSSFSGWQCPCAIDVSTSDYWVADIDDAGQLSIYENDGGSSASVIAATLTENVWYFVALSRDGGTDDTSAYVIPASSGAWTTSTLSSTKNSHASNQRVWIGNNAYSEVTLGAIAAVKIWTAALTQDEIEREKYSYAPVRKSDLWGFFPLNTWTPDFWKDRGPNQYHMTPAGTLTWADNPPIPNERVILPVSKKLILPIWLASGGPQTFSHTASGGLTAGGVASIARTLTVSISGGMTAGGASGIARTQVHPIAGGLTAGGAAVISKTILFTHAASGGLTASGAAPLARTQVHPVSGGLTAGGTAPLARTQVHPVSGGLTAGGTATTSLLQPGSYSHTATGGITVGGTAAIARTLVPALSGGLTTGGTSTVSRTWALAATGGLTGGGAATAAKTALFTQIASGGATLGGAAVLSSVAAWLATGGITFAGAADVTHIGATVYSHTASGGLTANGIADLARLWNFLADGGLDVGGAATTSKVSASSASAVEVALEILDNQYLEPGVSVRNGLRLILAALAGKVAGADTDTITIRNPADTVTRITANVDQYGNRLAVNYDLSDG